MGFLDERIKSSAFIVGAFTFFAYIKQYLYYKYYYIDISDYISIEEVFTPFIDDIASYGLMILLTFFAASIFTPLELLDAKLEKTVSAPKLDAIAKWANRIMLTLFIIVIIGLISSIVLSFTLERSKRYSLLLIAPILLVMMIIVAKHIYSNKEIDSFASRSPLTSFIILLSIIFLMFNAAELNFIFQNKEKQYKEVTYRFIKSDGFEILTDSTCAYLGRTKSNFFILKIKTKQVDVYNTSDIVKETVFHKN